MAITEERVVRASLAWLLVALAGVFVVGMLGGFLADWWQQPNWPGLPDAQDRLLTTIQEVTISPNTATADLVSRHERSAVFIARGNQLNIPVASGIVVTSDGVVATTVAVPEGELGMLDSTGRPVKLARVGTDVLYGITYLRATAGVFVPMEVRDNTIPVGSTLVALSRTPETFSPRVNHFMVEEYRLPAPAETVGWQQIIQGTNITSEAAVGSALLDDEGRVAALLLPGNDGRALPSPILQASLKRLAQNRLEINPFQARGFKGEYAFLPTGDGSVQFTMTITAVTPTFPASAQGLRAGDVIEAINGAPLAWHTSVAEALAGKEPVTLQVRRGQANRMITL